MTQGQPDIEFAGVTKRYGAVTAVAGIDLAIPRGGFMALLGPSGCGKTTCLRMIGGFEQPSQGEVRIRGQDMAGTPPHRRPVNMVFQHYALFPHLPVGQNVGYGLRQLRPRLDRREIARQVDEALALVQLSGYGRRRVHELSGGQQQRVALARALINKPAVLLLDEPLAALDKKLRTDMQIELQSLQRELGITFLLVTHDQEEALSMSDLVCVMNRGRIVQLGAPDDVYDRPADAFVAGFVGKANFLAGIVEAATDGVAEVRLANGSVLAVRAATGLARGASVRVAVRPEALRLGAVSAILGTGTVRHRIFLGSTAEYAIELPGLGTLLATAEHHAQAGTLFSPGEPVVLGLVPQAAIAFAEDDNGPNPEDRRHVEALS